MAGEPAFEGLTKLLKAAREEGITAIEDAAAAVYLEAIRNAASRHRRTGQLQSSVAVFKSINRKVLAGSNVLRVMVGPGKAKGYYGYFLEHGWKQPKGPRITYTTKEKTYTTGRRRRLTGGSASSQMGREGFNQIPARPWFESAVRAADGPAETAAEAAFEAKLRELDSRF